MVRPHQPGQGVFRAVLPEEIAVAIVAEMIHIRRAGFKHPVSKKLLQATHT